MVTVAACERSGMGTDRCDEGQKLDAAAPAITKTKTASQTAFR